MAAVATIDGGVIAVFAKQSFSGQVSATRLNLTVGLLGAMSELANILSFFWTSVGVGRSKVRLTNLMQGLMVGAIACIALVPVSGPGLWVLLLLVLAARVCWSGMITLRPTVWRANYPRGDRARIVGVLSGVQVLNVAVVGASLAWVLDHQPGAYRVFLPCAAAVGAVGVWLYSRLRMRREGKTLREEVAEGAGRVMQPWHGPMIVLRVLREDPWYARFMLWMFILGFGNLMILPTLAISLKEEFGFGHLQSVLVTSSIPAAMTLAAIPFWRRFLDRTHVVQFRAIHSWVFVAASACYTFGAWSDGVWWYFVGAGMMGVGYGGGSLAWNLGHVDFARPSQTGRYMATHVTLNGVRGLAAPLVVTSAYEAIKKLGLDAHLWVQGAALVVSMCGAAGFVHLRSTMGSPGTKGRGV